MYKIRKTIAKSLISTSLNSNIIKCENVKKVVAKINKTSFGDLLETIELASVISPREITAAQIVSYIRATSNKRGNNINKLYKLVNNKVEALEFIAGGASRVLGIPIKDLKLKSGILIAGLIKNGKIIIPSGGSVIEENDGVIIVTASSSLMDLDEILA